ncbi:MAG: flagellar hook-associated protein FlgK [Deltaproteobacteria bacterium]|nr:flagellar hook-associated protein FlgK [Deltaproteobacteria bacterium]
MSGISILNIAKDALLSHQTAINLTGANVANVDTPGYSRQRPIFQSVGTIDMGTGQIQIGVEIESIERIYDQFLEVQINDQMHDLGYNETRKEELEKIEIIFNETAGGGISELLNEFWNAWGDLSENPSGQAERLALVAAAENLTYMFRSYGNDLISIRNNANAKVYDLVNQINNYLTDIADLNEKIMQMMSGTGETNDLLDKRSELMKELAEIIDYQYIEDATGSVHIFLSNGTSLVEGENTWQLDVTTNPANSFYYDIVLADDPNETSINSIITGGQLAGLIDIRDNTAANYLNSLNNLTTSFVNEINTQHRLGYDLEENLGGDFFDPTMIEAKDMIVSSDILSDINKIAASATVNGDGANAISMGALKDQAVTINGETATFNSHYSSFMAHIGQDVADGSIRYDHSESLMSQLVNKQEGISGVSVDDEMINLMQYQMGYNAAAKLCSVADELIDTLLSLVQ